MSEIQKEMPIEEVKKPSLLSMLSVGDWIMFIVLVVVAVLGVLGTIFGQSLTARLISAATAATFLSVWVLYVVGFKVSRWRRIQNGLLTKQNISVYVSPKTSDIGVEKFNNWAYYVASHWAKHLEGVTGMEIVNAMKGIEVFIKDIPHFDLFDGQRAKGWYWMKQIGIATIPPSGSSSTHRAITQSLFVHELSHRVIEVVALDKYSTGAEQHELFKTTGLGA